jgi:hypothetical protein
MNEPRRLSEIGADDFEQDLLRSARGDGPRPAALRRTLATLGVGVSLPLGVASVAEGAVVVPIKLGTVALTKWLATGMALGVATAGGAKLTERAWEPARPAVVVTAKPTPAPRAAQSARIASTIGVETARVTEQAEVTESAPAVAVPAPNANGASAPVATASSLPEEVRSLDAARSALAEGDARGALALLRRYDARFGTGALSPEARVLEVKALLAAGERTRAVATANRIIELDPKSPHAEAVRTLLARSSFP